jgi:hypothetical protein
MPKRYQLRPTFDRKHNKWRLNLPPQISPSGKRERHLFEKHHEALAEANKLKQVFHDFGRSIKMLPANRLVESIECWDLLDELAAGASASGSLKRIVVAEIQKRKARQQSITLAALFDSYLAKLQRTGKSENYQKQFRWLRGYMDFWLETKVSDLTAGNIRFSLQKLPSGNFNSNLRLLRAVLNHGLKLGGFLKSNPALSIDFAYRGAKKEVKCLHHSVVEKMFRHAQAHDIELIPPWTIGFFAGVRESELWKLRYSDIRMSEKYVIVPAEISKVKRKRINGISKKQHVLPLLMNV